MYRTTVFAGLKRTMIRQLLLILALSTCSVATVSADILKSDNVGGVDIEVRSAGSGTYPLIIFSHGMGACPDSVDGIQGRLADAGYIVVAPKHADCINGSTTPDTPWREPQNWTDQTTSNRRDDIHAVLEALPSSSYAQYIKDFESIGCMGHSMGGYTCMGLAGAWDSWARSEVNAVAALSPWHKPYLLQDRVAKMSNDYTLYQGGTLDRPNTPELTQSSGTYEETMSAKYLQVFNRAGHFAWTDRLRSRKHHSDMSYYLIAFFDAALKGGSVEMLKVSKSRVKTLSFEN